MRVAALSIASGYVRRHQGSRVRLPLALPINIHIGSCVNSTLGHGKGCTLMCDGHYAGLKNKEMSRAKACLSCCYFGMHGGDCKTRRII